MNDPYTMVMRLCDDSGMVSHALIPRVIVSPDESYLGQLNRLRRSSTPPGTKVEDVTEPFVCTGDAHLVGEHIRCTNWIHEVQS